ncbi:unnamed protein product [Boreogadus saida]
MERVPLRYADPSSSLSRGDFSGRNMEVALAALMMMRRRRVAMRKGHRGEGISPTEETLFLCVACRIQKLLGVGHLSQVEELFRNGENNVPGQQSK